uniref:Putative globin 1 n=1 Tax=Culex tarsalis TaxID=7177 RepID=A0A1Q3FVI8_CULTA
MNEAYETEQNEEIIPSIPDETGLTNHQKVALIGAWSLVKKDIISHGRNIFVRFFEENPKYLNYFDFSQDRTASEIGENKSLHAHALNVMHFIGTLIDYGLYNPAMFKCSLSKLMKNHLKRGVKKEDVTIVCGVIMKYCLEVLDQHQSTTLQVAFASLMKGIADAFDE